MQEDKTVEELRQTLTKLGGSKEPLKIKRRLPFVWELTSNGTVSHAIGTCHDAPHVYQAAVDRLLDGKQNVFLENTFTEHEYLHFRLSRRVAEIDKFLEQIKQDEGLYRDCTESPEKLALIVGHYERAVNKIISGHPTIHAIDDVIFESAFKRNIPIYALENPADIQRGQDIDQKLDQLLAKNGDHISGEHSYRAFLKGNVRTLRTFEKKLDAAQDKYLPRSEAQFLRARAQRMAVTSLTALEEPCLIGAGAAHFVAEQPTILDFYRKQEIKIKRI